MVYFAVCCTQRTVFDFFFSLSLSIVLEETLLDDLLNFATTPKGLLLLQNTGTVTECVTFMFNRFMKNLQVGIIVLKYIFGTKIHKNNYFAYSNSLIGLHCNLFLPELFVGLRMLIRI